MKIASHTPRAIVEQAPRQPSAASRADSFAAQLAASSARSTQAAGATPVDFSNMSRKELGNWVKSRTDPPLTLDESMAFMAMTIHIPVDGSLAGQPGDHEPVDFVTKARDGLAHARATGDARGVQLLQTALAIMERSAR